MNAAGSRRLHVAVMFINIGGYHAARLRAANAACQERDWDFTGLQVTNRTFQHPWGDVASEITFPLDTLLSSAGVDDATVRPGLDAVDRVMVEAWLDRVKPDVLALPGWGFPVTRMALRWCRRRRVRCIVMSETKWDDEPRRWWKEALKAILYVRQFDGAVVSGERQREYLVRLGFAPERTFVGYSTVDNDHFATGARIARADVAMAHARWPHLPRRPYFLSMTRLVPRKNVATLIRAYDAYRGLVASREPWELVICGSGDEERRLRALAAELGIAAGVHFPGFVPYEALGAWYGLAQAFVHPALIEPWGLVINEACAAGLPILCSTTVGACDALVREGRNGFVFDPREPDALTRALVEVHSLEPEQRDLMGLASQHAVAGYGAGRFGAALAAAVELISSGRGRHLRASLSQSMG